MPDFAFIDSVSNLECVEDRGVMRSLTRRAMIKFTQNELTPGVRDYNILSAALQVLTDAGVIPRQILGDVFNSEDRFAPLVLVKRVPKVMNDPALVEVILHYEHLIEGPNQDLISTPNGVLYGKGRTSIVQKTTNSYYPYGKRTPYPDPDDPTKTITPTRKQILVAHEFPPWEVGIVATPYDPNFPRTAFQGGDIEIPYPSSNYHVEGIVRTNAPRTFSAALIACINEVEWMGDPPLTWICSEIQWEVMDPSVNLADANSEYRMAFEFQYNVDTWDPTVVFNDSRTGRPPAGVLLATADDANGVRCLIENPLVAVGNPARFRPAGLWQVPALKRVDFNKFFKSLFDGAKLPEIE